MTADRPADSLALPDHAPSGGRAFQASLLFAILFLTLHLPYLPPSLEDLDSINFALGVRHFDVAHHQPHPPGYPVFIGVAKAVHAVVPSEATTLSLVSVVAGSLGVFAIAALCRRVEQADESTIWPLAATAVAIAAPLYWFTAERPLSDVAGLAAALAVQVMILSASSVPALAVAGFAAGVAAGFRSQVVWLTVPLLALRAVQGLGAGAWGPERRVPNPQSVIPILLALIAGVLAWFVPLVLVTGGPRAYWDALFNQGAEDLGNIQMLWTRHDPRSIADAMYYAFISPWAAWPLAAVVLLLAALGIVRALRRAPHALVWLAVGFGPYLAFDLLFQETFTSRYALPLVIPMAYLAVSGARLLPGRSGLALTIPLAMIGAHIGGTSVAAYARQKAPAFRLLDDMRRAARSTREPPVLAMDRRDDLDFKRPINWVGDAVPAVVRSLPAPPQHEWLEPVKYWNSGGRAPVWFVVDPMRTSIDLVQHGEPAEYRWSLPYPVLVSGVRPNEMNWYQVDRPEWYVGEGWALTPEAAGVAQADRRDLSHGQIDGWINREAFGAEHRRGVLMIGGRNFDPAVEPRLTVQIAGRTILAETLRPGPFLRVARLPADLVAADYAKVTVGTSEGARVAIEQFDASATRAVFGFGEGWHEQELNPQSGKRWRWLSERGVIEVWPPTARDADVATIPRVTLHLEGESPLKYFSRGSLLTIRVGDQVISVQRLQSDFSIDIAIPGGGSSPSLAGPLILETDQVYVPADRSRRSADRRHLGLRIYRCEIRAVS